MVKVKVCYHGDGQGMLPYIGHNVVIEGFC